MDEIKSFLSGLNMGKIGDFEFYMNENDYKKIAQTITATHGSFIPVKGQETLSDAGGYSNKISLNGVLVLQPLTALKKLEDYTKEREALRFTTLQIDIEVVINSLNIIQEYFTDNGKFTVQRYNLSLKEVYDAIQ